MRRGSDGRPHPYDPPARCKVCDGRGEIVVTSRDLFGARTTCKPCKPCKGKGEIERSHFRTCVDADAFRGEREDDPA